MSKDYIADRVIWHRGCLTYTDVHTNEWTTEDLCRHYISVRFNDLRKAGVTRRTNKLWRAAKTALCVNAETQISDSLWQVNWISSDDKTMPKLKNFRHYAGHIFENQETMKYLGYVSAPDEQGARMAACVTLGPRAHSGCVNVVRVGIGGWENAKKKNMLLIKKYKSLVEHVKLSLIQKQWELEQVECQVAFLEVEATFDSVTSQ